MRGFVNMPYLTRGICATMVDNCNLLFDRCSELLNVLVHGGGFADVILSYTDFANALPIPYAVRCHMRASPVVILPRSSFSNLDA